MGLRVDRLFSGRALYCTERATWRDTTCDVPRGFPYVLWHMGKPMVRVQPSGHGMVSLFSGRVTCKLMDPDFSIWYGVQADIGGSCVKVMLRAIWPSINDIRQYLRPRLLVLPRAYDIT